MHPLNWVIVIGWLGYVVITGIRRSRGIDEMEGYLRANRSLPWWAANSLMMRAYSALDSGESHLPRRISRRRPDASRTVTQA